jgi:hypothetical protein
MSSFNPELPALPDLPELPKSPKPPLRNILFTAVVGPHGVDGPHSRYKNPMSLLNNQVTRGQRHYSVQMFSRTFAYDLFGANLDANVAVLDFPSSDIGIGSAYRASWPTSKRSLSPGESCAKRCPRFPSTSAATWSTTTK